MSTRTRTRIALTVYLILFVAPATVWIWYRHHNLLSNLFYLAAVVLGLYLAWIMQRARRG